MPRFVCGRDWTSPDGLRGLLEEAARAEGHWTVAPRRAAKVMTPPREAPPNGARRTKPSSLEVGFAPPDAEKPSRGLVPLTFEVDGPSGSGELALKVESALVYAKKFELGEDRVRLATFLNTHFLRNGTNRLEASVTQAGKAVWSEAFVLNVSNAGAIADRVRASLREHGTPMVLEGFVDSSAYDIAEPSLSAWFDRPDALSHLAAMRDAGTVTTEEAGALRQFVEDGYAILPVPVEEPLLATIERELDDAIEKKIEGYEYGTSQRIHHLHRQYPGVRALWRHPAVMRYLELIFGVPPRACQTLIYIFGSQQGAHQDTIHLTPFPAGYMCGVWIALEDVQPDSGELEVYKGSHRLPRVYMDGSGCAKVTNDDWNEFGDTVAARWREMLAEGRFEKMTYRPKRGTVLIWHENLMHGGSVRIDQSLSRRSIVSHYFADGAIAFYDSTGVAGYME